MVVAENINLATPHGLLAALRAVREEIFKEGQAYYSKVRPKVKRRTFIYSGLNLAYYLALRHRDMRPLQTYLMPLGLSSMGTIETRVMPTLDAMLNTLGTLCNEDPANLPKRPSIRAFFRGERMLERKLLEIFGRNQNTRRIRIMVTMPTEAANDYPFVRELVDRGMDCIRINCAHDSVKEWANMLGNLRRAEAETGRKCKVYMDLAGPKVRTSNLIKPKDQKLIFVGDKLLLTLHPKKNNETYPVQISCTLKEVFPQIKLGSRVFIDDGKIGTVVREIVPEGFVLEVFQANPEGAKLKTEKGMNFPDMELNIAALTAKDKQDLDFAAKYADIIGYSFVQSAKDIAILQQELEKRLGDNWRKMAIVAKIETPRAVANLPEMIVQAGSQQPFGVMIARGDLAVELGFQRMAEIQEEILWLCEAAHIPVIWATQVLETLVKTGIPTRAEMTDAAMSQRADCVMLNKGQFVSLGVSVLDDVLRRMDSHRAKNISQLRPLKVWS